MTDLPRAVNPESHHRYPVSAQNACARHTWHPGRSRPSGLLSPASGSRSRNPRSPRRSSTPDGRDPPVGWRARTTNRHPYQSQNPSPDHADDPHAPPTDTPDTAQKYDIDTLSWGTKLVQIERKTKFWSSKCRKNNFSATS